MAHNTCGTVNCTMLQASKSVELIANFVFARCLGVKAVGETTLACWLIVARMRTHYWPITSFWLKSDPAERSTVGTGTVHGFFPHRTSCAIFLHHVPRYLNLAGHLLGCTTAYLCLPAWYPHNLNDSSTKAGCHRCAAACNLRNGNERTEYEAK